MNAYRSKSLRYPWPVALHGLACIAAVALKRVLPIPVKNTYGEWIPWTIGAIFTTLGVVLCLWAIRTLLDRQTTVLPNRCSSHLVTCGPFRLSRNPIYLGYTVIMIGIGMVALNPWFFVLAIVTVIITTVFAVRAEERHLLSRFGIEFERYCRRTSRWI
ncbi:protein-S-isoprenylcysteine O-methyltransferase Ste14 [Pararhizobium capsulatum DSM 1112]|uniref:Protein-S-isoprenylcysteine O-methyltransferase Ste14 n=1 Tax=Pararhizobium capsulatum DSM 1112 TaxID=1121113 RepID=A0ABU0BP76_9HYPH|nr:isoprenylcysteine carboxylmethyltransferase family protein [Pararhizobium capsulatum]MDQ0320054.1 protein-S-isoprenylcysteine O-methyltransferase Ste14 [Pararhizobium capsulatum DSM 1112]